MVSGVSWTAFAKWSMDSEKWSNEVGKWGAIVRLSIHSGSGVWSCGGLMESSAILSHFPLLLLSTCKCKIPTNLYSSYHRRRVTHGQYSSLQAQTLENQTHSSHIRLSVWSGMQFVPWERESWSTKKKPDSRDIPRSCAQYRFYVGEIHWHHPGTTGEDEECILVGSFQPNDCGYIYDRECIYFQAELPQVLHEVFCIIKCCSLVSPVL